MLYVYNRYCIIYKELFEIVLKRSRCCVSITFVLDKDTRFRNEYSKTKPTQERKTEQFFWQQNGAESAGRVAKLWALQKQKLNKRPSSSQKKCL